MKTHIPNGMNGLHTYCGRFILKTDSTGYVKADSLSWYPPCIDTRTTVIDDAECKACQRSDDRRVRESYQREQAALPPEKRDGYYG